MRLILMIVLIFYSFFFNSRIKAQNSSHVSIRADELLNKNGASFQNANKFNGGKINIEYKLNSHESWSQESDRLMKIYRINHDDSTFAAIKVDSTKSTNQMFFSFCKFVTKNCRDVFPGHHEEIHQWIDSIELYTPNFIGGNSPVLYLMRGVPGVKIFIKDFTTKMCLTQGSYPVKKEDFPDIPLKKIIDSISDDQTAKSISDIYEIEDVNISLSNQIFSKNPRLNKSGRKPEDVSLLNGDNYYFTPQVLLLKKKNIPDTTKLKLLITTGDPFDGFSEITAVDNEKKEINSNYLFQFIKDQTPNVLLLGELLVPKDSIYQKGRTSEKFTSKNSIDANHESSVHPFTLELELQKTKKFRYGLFPIFNAVNTSYLLWRFNKQKTKVSSGAGPYRHWEYNRRRTFKSWMWGIGLYTGWRLFECGWEHWKFPIFTNKHYMQWTASLDVLISGLFIFDYIEGQGTDFYESIRRKKEISLPLQPPARAITPITLRLKF